MGVEHKRHQKHCFTLNFVTSLEQAHLLLFFYSSKLKRRTRHHEESNAISSSSPAALSAFLCPYWVRPANLIDLGDGRTIP